MKIKVLLIKAGDKYGLSLRAIRERANEMIDISSFEAGLSDATGTTCQACIIKDNKVYRVVRNYFDLDKNERIFVAKLDMDPNDIYPIPEEEIMEESK